MIAAGICLVFAVFMGAIAFGTGGDSLAITGCVFGVVGAMLFSG